MTCEELLKNEKKRARKTHVCSVIADVTTDLKHAEERMFNVDGKSFGYLTRTSLDFCSCKRFETLELKYHLMRHRQTNKIC